MVLNKRMYLWPSWFRLTVNYAKKALGDKGKGDAEERMGEIIRCLPSHASHLIDLILQKPRWYI
jgi:hypothetical protein